MVYQNLRPKPVRGLQAGPIFGDDLNLFWDGGLNDSRCNNGRYEIESEYGLVGDDAVRDTITGQFVAIEYETFTFPATYVPEKSARSLYQNESGRS